VLLIVTWRGEPGGDADEPQHELMGRITPQLLELIGIPWSAFPAVETDVETTLDRACEHMKLEGRPYALVMQVCPPGPVPCTMWAGEADDVAWLVSTSSVCRSGEEP
jgi:phosphonopyruvate decarboxylase